jgi:hypothetical protein
MTWLVHVLGLALAIVVFLGVPLGLLRLGVVVLRDHAGRRWELVGQAAFLVCVLAVLVLVSGLVMLFTAGVGDNGIRVESGEAVARYGFPIQFATSISEDWLIYGYAGDDPPFNPWEIPTTFDTTRVYLCWAFWFAITLIATFSLFALARRSTRGRPLRPSARPS